MKALVLFFLLFLLNSCVHTKQHDGINQKSEDLYRSSQREFKAKNYKNALKLFKAYLKRTDASLNDERRIFWVLNKAGYVFLKVYSDPDAAVDFFEPFKKDLRLSEAQQATVAEWVSAAKDLKEDKSSWAHIPRDKDILFTEGKNLFKKAISKKKYEADKRGNIELWAAKKYLSPFITYYNSDPRIVEALIMLGRIQTYLKSDQEYWDNNFYLKEAIRRAPGTKLAKDAWMFLYEDIHQGYSGSSGSDIPSSMERMLKSFRAIAYG